MAERRGALISVDRFSGFWGKTAGLPGEPFPLSIRVSQIGQICVADGTAIRAADVVDVLAVSAGRFAAVLNMDQASWLGPGLTPVPPAEIARRQGVTAMAHNSKGAEPGAGSGAGPGPGAGASAAGPGESGPAETGPAETGPGDLITVRWAELGRFFAGWSVHDVDIADLGDDPAGLDAAEVARVVSTSDGEPVVLDRLTGAKVYYSGHDDCEFHVESTDGGLPARLLARLLVLIAGGALLTDDAETITLAEPEPQLTAGLLRASACWTGAIARRRRDEPVRIRLAARFWQEANPVPVRTDAAVTFDPGTGTWAARHRLVA